jgi:hypothetical protein
MGTTVGVQLAPLIALRRVDLSIKEAAQLVIE